MNAYEPGLYAVDSWRGKNQLAFRIANRAHMWVVLDGNDTRGLKESEVTDVRPMRAVPADAVVLDLTRVQIDGLTRALDRWIAWSSLIHEQEVVRNLLDAVAEQARPPRPDEPLGLGAVVVDGDREWVHFGNGSWIKCVPNAGLRLHGWDEFDDPHVLSEGWSE